MTMLCLCFSLGASAQSRPPHDLRIMFIGNSLTGVNDMPKEFVHLATINGRAPYVEAFIAFGQTLSHHLTRADLRAALAKKKWDFVVLQEYSNRPLLDPKQFEADALAFRDLIVASGAKPVLFENWPYRGSPRDTIDRLEAAYVKVGRSIGADVVPLGHAFDDIARNSTIEMYTDEKHATPIATYMGASLFLKYFYGIPVSGNVPGGVTALPSFFSITIDEKDFQYVQTSADRHATY